MAALYELVASLYACSVRLCFIVFLFIAFFVHRHHRRFNNLPPGPRCWPVLGCLPELVRTKLPIHELACSLGQKYGPVCLLYTPLARAVVISGYEAVNECLTSEKFIWKSPGYKGSVKGIIGASGDIWQEHRRVSTTVLRGFGVGKRSFEEQITSESDNLMKEISAGNGKAFDRAKLLRNAVSNVICSVIFGRRFDYHDTAFANLLHLMEESISHVGVGLLQLTMPFLAKIPFFPKGGIPSNRQLRLKLNDIVNMHRDTYDKDHMRDFIDVYLKELEMKKEQGIHTYLNDQELVAVVRDFFIAGTETTSTTLRWALLYMLKYPNVQKSVQAEIDSVVGRDRLPNLSDKPSLPYTEAVIHEIQRIARSRYTRYDVEFRGYTIPKGTHVICYFYSVSRDPSIWNEPNDFKPERFLNDNGVIKKIPGQIPFGAGKRVCLGEQLARMELFIFFTHLMHRFSFKKPEDEKRLNMLPKPGGMLAPYPYRICAIAR